MSVCSEVIQAYILGMAHEMFNIQQHVKQQIQKILLNLETKHK
jgi:hypothetical protein